MKKRRNTDKYFPWWQYLLGGGVFLTALTFSALLVLDLAQKPYQLSREQLTALARQSADVVEVEHFELFAGKQAYGSLIGKTSQGQEVAVLKQASEDKLYVYELDKGVSQNQAEQVATANGAAQIDRTIFGRLDEKPIWEVKSGTIYYIVDFETGELTSKEGL